MLTLDRSIVSGNCAPTGAGLYLDTASFDPISTITASTISGNIADGAAGGLYLS